MDDRGDAEWTRFLAYGNQLVEVHQRLREMLDDLRDGVIPERELGAHCLAFCDALTAHHTQEDREIFPVLAARHPELRDFLDSLARDHVVIADMISRLRHGEAGHETGLDAVLRTHFLGEEKRLTGVLNALSPSVGLTPLTQAVDFR